MAEDKDEYGSILPPLNMEIAMEQIAAHLPMMLEYDALHAKRQKAKFDVLIEVGFTEAQALELCKVMS